MHIYMYKYVNILGILREKKTKQASEKHTHTCKYIFTYICIYIYTYICIYVCLYAYTFEYSWDPGGKTWGETSINKNHIYIYTYIHGGKK